MRVTTPWRAVAGAAVAVLLLAACGGDEPEAAAESQPADDPADPEPDADADDGADDAADEPTEPPAPEPEGEDADGPLVLYTNDFEDIIGERFTADTGLDIEVVQESGGVLLARIAAERANPQWDVLLFDGPGSLFRLDEEEQLLRGFEPANLANLTDQARELLPQNRSWFPVGTTASCLLAYRTDLVDDPPTSLDDLTDPRFRGQIGQADPAVAAPAYPCVAQLFHDRGFEAAQELYRGILDNELRVFRTNGPTRQALESGEISVALLSSPQVYRIIDEGVPVAAVWPEDGAPSSSRGTAIQAGTQRPVAARAFVEWMLEPATQQFLTDEGGNDGWFLASVDGVTPKPDGPPAEARYAIAPPAFASDQEAAIKEWFADQAIN